MNEMFELTLKKTSKKDKMNYEYQTSRRLRCSSLSPF